MEIEYIYPPQKKRKQAWEKTLRAAKWLSVATAYACPIINLCTGGKAWSIVVLWSLWFLWSSLLEPSLVEYNRISQTSKALLNTCILLILIDTIFSSGWAEFVIPVVSFGTLVIIGILFLSDLSKQKQNMMPMVWLILASFVAIIASLIGWPAMNWPMIALGATALALLIVCIVVLRQDLLRELIKRFHTK